MKDDLSQMEDEFSRLSKKLSEEGESEEVCSGLDKILVQLSAQLFEEDTPPSLIRRIGTGLANFFNGILRRHGRRYLWICLRKSAHVNLRKKHERH